MSVPEPSPDDDVIVRDRMGVDHHRCGADNHRHLWALDFGTDVPWSELVEQVGPLRIYVPAVRLAAVEAERDAALATIARVQALADWSNGTRRFLTGDDIEAVISDPNARMTAEET